MKTLKRSFPWLIAGFVILGSLAQLFYLLPIQMQTTTDPEPTEIIAFIGVWVVLFLVANTCAVLGTLIVTRKSGHRIGWLLLILGASIVTTTPITPVFEIFYPTAPAVITPVQWLLLWLGGWVFLVMILPVFLILLNFPSGHPPSHRWNWLNQLAVGMIVYQAVITAFTKEIGPENGAWVVKNPVGFITENIVNFLSLPYYPALLVFTAGSIAAIIVRSRRADGVERLQIRWLLFSGALCFVAVGILVWVFSSGNQYTSLSFGPFLLVFLFFLTLPISIAIAILRYRLYDIDIIIRRTLSYSILTAVLGLVYFAGVVVLQNVFDGLFGNTESPLIDVLSTLAIAALFNPLRSRIQVFIDRRFFRSKYNAEQALAEFSTIARDEVDMARLSGSLLGVVENTMQPEQTSLWLRESARGK